MKTVGSCDCCGNPKTVITACVVYGMDTSACPKCKHFGCEYCGDEDFTPNIEAFEISGEIVCDECADGIFEDNSQFGVGA